MRRFLTLFCLLCVAIPVGISISGCVRNPDANYCNGQGYGMKITDVASITLYPVTAGISIAFGQTGQVSVPAAFTCKGTAATSGTYTYGTTNNQLVDISPTGNICAGTWNRNTSGGVANYTICSPPNPLPSTGDLPYGIAYITASAQSVTSNPVEVFVHPQVTSISLVTTPLTGSAQKCFSQGVQATLDAQACYASNNTQYELCAPPSVTSNYACAGGLPPGVTSVPDCTAAIGSLSYAASAPATAAISTNTTTNTVTITAEQPGTTSITASVAGSGSSAGFFSTCPPASILLTIEGGTAATIDQGVTQTLVYTAYDTNQTLCPPTGTNPSGGCPITGLNLDYQSTDPMDISVGGGGAIYTAFPGVASVYAICQPPFCNPSPLDEVGWYGTGLPVSSNPVKITTPGTASDYVWFSAPGQSQYFVPVELLTGTVGSTVRLPYVPNSMMMDRLGTNLYFGSPHELMSYNTTSNAITVQNASIPGVVLAVAPDDSQVLINDQERQIFYIYYVTNGAITTFGGMGNAAAWTPDAQTLYITDNAALNSTVTSPEQGITGHTDTLYIYNSNTGWTVYNKNTVQTLPSSPLVNPLPPGLLPPSAPPDPMPANVAISSTVQTPALVIPSVGAYLRGFPTVAHTWCPTGTVGDYASLAFYPQWPTPAGPSTDNSVDVQTDALVATTDGRHILGASAALSVPGPITLSDIGVTIPPSNPGGAIPTYNCLPPVADNNPLANGDPLSLLLLANPEVSTTTLTVNATAINQVIASPESNLAFITYTADETNTNAQLPYYQPNQASPGALGTVGYIPLTGGSAISAPLAGAFTPDDQTFFVSTAGDNKIHYISVPLITSNPSNLNIDTKQISPNLPACTPVSVGGVDAGCTFSGTGPIVPATAIAIKPRAVT